ncbi:MAG TPA: LysM peptidoglycan-binding domain-containing protein [Candidatus Xenobia bacterium]|nr:LysM peptidoglycan-binding domain-containing protein [Candidatus Xenobia bacterium]
MQALWKVRIGLGAVVFASGVLLTSLASAQTLGDVARQARERRAQSPCPARVYTNDDLARPQILDAKDRACLEAARQSAPPVTPHLETATSAVAAFETRLPDTPLALIAPRDRLMKEARLAREARWAQEAKLVRESRGTRPLRTTPPVLQLEPASKVRARIAEQPAPAPGIAPTVPLRRPLRIEVAPAVRMVVPLDETETEISNGKKAIRVRRGDSLWKIAARHLGDGNAWRWIAKANPQITDPNVIRIGDVIQLPETTGFAAATVATATDAPVVRVEHGDTLWQLAQARFGRGTAWTCIAQTNQLRNPDLILPGQVLTLPGACK